MEAGKDFCTNPQHSHCHTNYTYEPNADEFLGIATNNTEMGLEL
jgi:hypothetical protein